MVYDNITNKTTFIKKTGSEIITGDSGDSYTVDISSLFDPSGVLSSSTGDQDEIIVVRKFDHSTINDVDDYTHSDSPITADEAWSAWTLPNSNDSGSTMYSLSNGIVTFSQTASDYTWTSAMNGRSVDITLPAIAAGDEVYLLRKTYNLTKFVDWTAGSRLTSANLNQSTEQLLFLCQELVQMIQNVHTLNPATGQPNGIVPLNASGKIDSLYINITDTLALSTEHGISGTGDSTDPLKINRAGSNNVLSGLDIISHGSVPDEIRVASIDNLTSDATVQPLSAAQGKVLKGLIDQLGTSVSYRGAFDITSDTIVSGTPVAGWTIDHIGATGSRHAAWGDVDSDRNGVADTGSITTGSLLRYDGSMWVVVSVAGVLADGSVALTGTWDATGGTINADTQSAADSTTKVATTAFVQQEITGTKLSELVDVATSKAVATFTFSAGPDSVEALDTSTITLVDADGTSVVFEINDGSDGQGAGDPGVGAGNIPIINRDSGGSVVAGQMGPSNLATSLVYWINQQSALDIVATNPSGGQVTLTQGAGGADGNTTITLSAASTWNSSCSVNCPSAFTGGLTGSTSVAGDLIYWDGDNWEPISLNDTTPGTNKIITTGDALGDLSNVGSGAPSLNQALAWDGDSWEPTTVGGIPAHVVTCGGVGDGVANEAAEVRDALNSSTLGHTGTPSSTTNSKLDFRGRTHRCGTNTGEGTDLKVPVKHDVSIVNGTFEYDRTNTANSYLWNMVTPTYLGTTLSANMGSWTNEIQVTSVTGFSVGDWIWIEPDATDTRAQFVNENDNTSSIDVSNAIQQIQAIDVVSDTMYFEQELHFRATSGASVKRYGLDTSGVNQLVNLTFDNLHFKERNSQTFYPSPTGSDITDPITKTSSTGGTITLPTGHGMNVGGKMYLWDFHKTDALATQDIYDSINQPHSITSVAGDIVGFTLGNGATWAGAVDGTENTGGNTGIVVTTQNYGVRIDYGINITIKNCTFDGFNLANLTLYRCKNITIENCTFKNSVGKPGSYGAGIRIEGCENVTIKNCKFYRCTHSILIQNSSSVLRFCNRNISIRECEMNTEACGVYVAASINGLFEVLHCTCNIERFNNKRNPLNRPITQVTMMSDVANMPAFITTPNTANTDSCAEQFDISYNDCSKTVYLKYDTGERDDTEKHYLGWYGLYEGTRFYRSGLNGRVALNKDTISVRTTTMPYASDGKEGNHKRRITNNDILAWQHGVRVFVHESSSVDNNQEFQRISGINISNNTICCRLATGIGTGVETSGRFIVSETKINDNFMTCSNYLNYYPGREEQAYGDLRAIDIISGAAGASDPTVHAYGFRFHGCMIKDNYLKAQQQIGQGILFGRNRQYQYPATGSSTLNRDFEVTNNRMQNWKYAFYFYAAHPSTHTTFSRSSIRNNMFHSNDANWRGQDEFELGPNNISSGQNQSI